VAQLSWWVPPTGTNLPASDTAGLYAVVSPDYFGLAGKWIDFSGTVLGFQSSSEAVFGDGTSVLTRILAGSCSNPNQDSTIPPWPGSCSGQAAPSFQVKPAETVTGETNNLLELGRTTTYTSTSPELAFMQYLSSTSGACIPASNHVFIKDNGADTGAVPSDGNGFPFWESPDLFLVPWGATVDVNAAASCAAITPGQDYALYVRVNNDFGCDLVTGVKARVNLADPAMLSQDWDNGQVTGGDYWGMQDGGPNDHGITVNAGARALIGPFKWTAPTGGFGRAIASYAGASPA
jgi:hypothetical protein